MRSSECILCTASWRNDSQPFNSLHCLVQLLDRPLADSTKSGYILDGFPRTAAQAERLMETSNVQLALNMSLREEVLVGKCLGKRMLSLALVSGRCLLLLVCNDSVPLHVSNSEILTEHESLVHPDALVMRWKKSEHNLQLHIACQIWTKRMFVHVALGAFGVLGLHLALGIPRGRLPQPARFAEASQQRPQLSMYDFCGKCVLHVDWTSTVLYTDGVSSSFTVVLQAAVHAHIVVGATT